jgi:MerR family redox-sensitive transcriptional activator SoxR
MEVYLFKLALSQAFLRDGFMEELTINEVAKRAGIRASAIRYYESVQLLPPPQRSAGRRRYNPDVLRRISFIQVAQGAGLTIAEIQTLINALDDDTPLSERWQTLAHQKLAEVDALMRKVQGMKMILANGLNCRCTNLEECIDCIIRAEASC